MSLNILDAATLAAVAATDNKVDNVAVLASPWSGGNVGVRAFNGTTLLSTSTYAPWVVTGTQMSLAARLARNFVASGVPNRVEFVAGTTPIFEISAGTSSGDARFSAAVTEASAELFTGLTITARSELPDAPTLNLPSNAPNRVVVESWATGSAVDVGTITLDTLIRADRFSDPNLAADCAGWLEYGPASATGLPVLDGVQFSAKGFDIKAGGVYSQRSYRVMVMMRAVGNNTNGQPLVDGLFGDVRGVNHFPGPHKLRILSVAGNVLQRIEMRDGLPVNDTSFPPVPFDWTVSSRASTTTLPPPMHTVSNLSTSRVANDKNMRPHMAAGSAFLAFFGDEPSSSTATRNRIPRTRENVRPTRNTKTRGIFGDTDITAVGGNGFFHPDVVPEWGMSENQIVATSNVAPGDPDVFNPTGYNWAAALRNGWGHEPGAHGGITRRSGPGGVRIDRTSLPSEYYQMGLTMTTRPADGASTAAMARAHAKNQANYPCYYPKSMVTLDPINTFSTDPQPTVPGRDVRPIYHYYGGTYQGAANEVWIGDEYGNGTPSGAVEWFMPGTGTSRSTKGHVRNGWMPDSEHNVRNGAAWAALLYADPVFSRMAEHVVLESSIFSPVVAWGTWEIFGGNTAPYIADPGSFWASRSNIAPFCVATAMWWVATANGTYTRASIEERLHAFFARWKQTILDALPSTAVTASQRAYNMTGGLSVSWRSWDEGTDISDEANLRSSSGWVAQFALPGLYLGQFLLMAKSSGLLDVLKQNATSAYVLTLLEKQLEFHARWQAAAPHAIMTGKDGDNRGWPHIILREASAGAVQGDLSTVPTTITEALSYNPALRGDAYFFLRPSSTPGTNVVNMRGNLSTYGRIQAAWTWWKYFAPAGTERTAALAKIESDVALVGNYTPRYYDPGFARINFMQSVPALEV